MLVLVNNIMQKFSTDCYLYQLNLLVFFEAVAFFEHLVM